MKKGNVILFSKDKEEMKNIFNYILENLKLNIQKASLSENMGEGFIEVNGYSLIFKNRFTMNSRACKGEIVYLSKNSNIPLDDIYEVIIPMTSFSTRVEPLRLFETMSDIDLKELIDDEYSENFKIERGDTI